MSNDAHSTSTTSTTAHEIAHNWLEKFSAAFDVAAVTTLRKHWAAYFWMTAIGGISPLFPGTSPPQRDCLQFAT